MKKFLVALETGGVMEQPEIMYCCYQIIEAEDEKEAEEKYNQINDCSYYYGQCMGEIDEETQKVMIPISMLINP